MPDDIQESAEQETVEDVIETNEVAEDSDDGPMTDEQIQALFGSISDDESPEKKKPKKEAPKKQEAPTDDEEDDDDDDEDEDEDEVDGEEDEEEEEEDKDQESAADKLKKLADEAKTKREEAAKAEERQEKLSEAERDARKAATDGLAGQDTLEYNGKEIDLAEFREEYGELAEILEAMSVQTAATMVKQQLDASGYVSKDEFEAMKAEAANEKFISELHYRHPNAGVRDINNNPEHDFWKWVETQDDDTKAFLEDQTIHGMSAVLAAYEEAQVKEKNKVVDDAAREKKKRHVSIHSSSTRTKKAPSRKASESSENGKMNEAENKKYFQEIKIKD